MMTLLSRVGQCLESMHWSEVQDSNRLLQEMMRGDTPWGCHDGMDWVNKSKSFRMTRGMNGWVSGCMWLGSAAGGGIIVFSAICFN